MLAWSVSFWPDRPPLAEGRMLENKRERLKTFLRKIDEKAMVRIKHFMKERWVRRAVPASIFNGVEANGSRYFGCEDKTGLSHFRVVVPL